MSVAIDHVVVVVDGLDAAATTYEREFGLSSVAGGRHHGHGTANRIVPLGDSYIELVAVVDTEEAAASPFGSFMQQRLAESGTGSPVALCLRTDDITAVAARTGDRPFAMSRNRPDGVTLSWQTVALDAALELGVPFFIQWQVPDDQHPGHAAVSHRQPVRGIAWVEVGGDAERLAAWVDDPGVPLRAVGGRRGVHRFALAVDAGDEIVIG